MSNLLTTAPTLPKRYLFGNVHRSKKPTILNHGIMGRFFALSIQHSQRNNSFCFSDQLEHFRLLCGPKNFLRRVPFLSFVTFKNFFPIHANTSFSRVRGVVENLQTDHLMSRISVSDIPAYRPFIRRMSVSDKLTSPTIITKNWTVTKPNQVLSKVRERNNF